MKTNQRVPLAFIDKTGYVTPFNGRMDTTLSGWYIYTQEELDKALAQQRRLEEKRVVTDREVIGTHYAIDDAAIEEAQYGDVPDDSTPEWAKEVFGVDNTVPFLQLDKGENEPAPAVVAKTATVDDFHVPRDNVDLTQEQIEELQGSATNPADLVKQVLG